MDFCEESGESRMWILGEYSRYIGCQPFVRTLHNVHLSTYSRAQVSCVQDEPQSSRNRVVLSLPLILAYENVIRL